MGIMGTAASRLRWEEAAGLQGCRSEREFLIKLREFAVQTRECGRTVAGGQTAVEARNAPSEFRDDSEEAHWVSLCSVQLRTRN